MSSSSFHTFGHQKVTLSTVYLQFQVIYIYYHDEWTRKNHYDEYEIFNIFASCSYPEKEIEKKKERKKERERESEREREWVSEWVSERERWKVWSWWLMNFKLNVQW